jgi:hypothetical protein
MSKRFVVFAVFLGLAGVCGWAIAQQGGQPGRQGPFGGGPANGRYTTVAAGQSAILLDTRSGQSWVMTQGSEGDAAWLPAQKFDLAEEAHQWLVKERQRAEAQVALQRELANRLEELQRDMARRLEAIRASQGQNTTPAAPKDKK